MPLWFGILCRPKSIPHRVFGLDLITHSQERLGPVLQPQQHPPERQPIGIHPPTAPTPLRQHLPVQPHPHVPQDQRRPTPTSPPGPSLPTTPSGAQLVQFV